MYPHYLPTTHINEDRIIMLILIINNKEIKYIDLYKLLISNYIKMSFTLL